MPVDITGFSSDLCQLILFENQLSEVVEAVLPNCEVVTFIRIVDQGAGYSVLIAESLELCAVADKAVSAAAYHPEKLVLLLNLLNIRNELSGTCCIGS